jgi:hypothetical protein
MKLPEIARGWRERIIIFVLGLLLSLVCGCDRDKGLEADRQQLKRERIDLLIEIPHEFEDEWTNYQEKTEFHFWMSLRKNQRDALLNFMSDLDWSDNVTTKARVKAVDKMIGFLTPGMMIQLAELTKAREDILQQKPRFFIKTESYKERATRYYNQLKAFAYDKQPDIFANWEQSEKYYAEIKKTVFHKKYGDGQQELLYDLRNAMIGTESIAEPKE